IAELEQTVKEKDELMARIVELEQYKSDTVNLKTENIELRNRIAKLEQKQLQDIKSLVNTAPTEIESSSQPEVGSSETLKFPNPCSYNIGTLLKEVKNIESNFILIRGKQNIQK
ncbi:8230_t:CDS:2, partial [Racocetra fulgida]